MEIKTKFSIGDDVIITKNGERNMATIDTVSFIQFKNRDHLITDINYIVSLDNGDRIVVGESDCHKVEEELLTL